MDKIINLEHYLIVSALLFSIGIAGALSGRKSVVHVLMSIELMLLAVNINFIAFSHYLRDIVGQVFSIFVLAISAAEVSVCLAILVIYFNKKNSIKVTDISDMRG